MRRFSSSSLSVAGVVSLASFTACGGGWGGGSKWVQEPLGPEERAEMSSPGGNEPVRRVSPRTIGAARNGNGSGNGEGAGELESGAGGHVLGTFRNTYYDFPNEADHTGAPVSLMNAACEPIAKVPRGFYEAVCVQGSGSLARGGTVSFAKRDCSCAEVCPRTGQKICFEALDKTKYPYGRGAAGVAIKPLRSVAADTNVLPMGTIIYLPELDGVAANGGAPIDGCFVVEDRGLKVQGEHVDIFTGAPAQTALLNKLVPSNQGVTLVVDSPRCAHLAKR